MNIPDELHYTAEHEWIAELEDGRLRIGITDFAQDALGDVVYVDLPEPGRMVEVGSTVAEVESTKSVSEIYAPISGTSVEINEARADSPERDQVDDRCRHHPLEPHHGKGVGRREQQHASRTG